MIKKTKGSEFFQNNDTFPNVAKIICYRKYAGRR